MYVAQGPAAGSCEHGYELSGSIKSGEVLDQLSDRYLFEKEPVPLTWSVGWLVGWLVGSL